MSDDYNELVIDLREYLTTRQISDLLEAQAKRIAELEKREKHLEEMFHGWRDEANKASARIAELEAALTPLAEMDYWIEPHHNAHDSIEQCNQLTVAEIRAARAALKGEK